MLKINLKGVGLLLAATVVMVLVYAPASAAVTETERLAEARRITNCLAAGDFENTGKMYTEQMTAALSPKQLEAVWQGLATQYGHFKEAGQTRTFRLDGFDLVEQTLVFEKSNVIQRTVFDANGLVAGLFFRPDNVEAGTSPDASSNTNSPSR